MMKTSILFAAVLAVAGGCSKKSKDGGGGGGDVDASKANAAIPAAWKGKLEFDVQKLGEGKFGEPVNVAAPKGWKKGFMEGELDPPDGNKDFGFGTTFRAGSTCAGECNKEKPTAEWASAAESSYFANAKKDSEVIKDDKAADHHMLIVHNKSNGIDKTQVIYAAWTDGGKLMRTCQVDLPDQAKEVAPAFEQACLTVTLAN